MTEQFSATALIVDDDPAMRRLLARIAQRVGLRVIEAGNGEEGLARFREERPHIVLVDAVMPYLDGFAMTERLRELPGGGEVPVIMLTALQDSSVLGRAFSAGVTEFIEKPVDPELLINRLRLTLRASRAHQALAESEARYRQLVDLAPELIALEQGQRLVFVNAAGRRLLGEAGAPLLGAPLTARFHPDDRAALQGPLRCAMEGEEKTAALRARVLSGGEEVPVELTAVGLRHGGEPALLFNVRDLRRRKAIEARLGLASKVFECTGEAILITHADGTIVDVNPAFTAITGYSADEVVGQTPRIMKSGCHDAAFYADMWRCIGDAGCWHGEVWDRRKNGEVYPKCLTINAVTDESDRITHYVGIFSDITEAKQAETRLERLAHYDALTGLPNRLLFHARLDQALALAQRNSRCVALLLLDLDRFKRINDCYGHATGDQLLIQVAQRLSTAIREADTGARLGGDEFTVLLTDLPDAAVAERVAGKVLSSFREPFRLGEHEVRVSPSIGVALFPHCGASGEALLKAADDAMYASKRAGRNAIRFSRRHLGDAAAGPCRRAEAGPD